MNIKMYATPIYKSGLTVCKGDILSMTVPNDADYESPSEEFLAYVTGTYGPTGIVIAPIDPSTYVEWSMELTPLREFKIYGSVDNLNGENK